MRSDEAHRRSVDASGDRPLSTLRSLATRDVSRDAAVETEPREEDKRAWAHHGRAPDEMRNSSNVGSPRSRAVHMRNAMTMAID